MNGIVHPGTNQTDCQTTVNGTCAFPAGHKIRMDGTIDAQGRDHKRLHASETLTSERACVPILMALALLSAGIPSRPTAFQTVG